MNDLDRKVVEKVMGHERVGILTNSGIVYRWLDSNGKWLPATHDFSPTTDANDAFRVVDKMYELGYGVIMQIYGNILSTEDNYFEFVDKDIPLMEGGYGQWHQGVLANQKLAIVLVNALADNTARTFGEVLKGCDPREVAEVVNNVIDSMTAGITKAYLSDG